VHAAALGRFAVQLTHLVHAEHLWRANVPWTHDVASKRLSGHRAARLVNRHIVSSLLLCAAAGVVRRAKDGRALYSVDDGLQPRGEVVLNVDVIVTETHRHERRAPNHFHVLVYELSDRGEVLVRLVAQGEHCERLALRAGAALTICTRNCNRGLLQ
jgi:hypothetical protein